MAPRMAKVLVTGGAGFIGSNLVRALLERGDDVRVLDNFSTGNRANLEGVSVEVVEGELRSYERVHNAVRGTEVVYHLGALGSVPRSVQDPLTSSAVNVEGTLNVLLAARDEGVRRVIYTSSSSVYGSSDALPAREDAARTRCPRTGWRSSRPSATASPSRACTRASKAWSSATSTSSARARAPRSQYAAVIPLFITRIAAGEPITIEGDGEQRRDFTYVDNVLDGTLLAGDAADASGRIFNVASSAPASVNEVADTIGRILGKEVVRQEAPPRAGDIRNSWADVTAAREALGWEPSVGLEEGLRRTAEFLV